MFEFWHSVTDDSPLSRAISPCRSLFIGAALFSALINLLYLTPTLYMMQVYDRAIPAASHATLALLSLVAVAGLAALSVLDWVRSRLLVRASARIDHALAAPVMDAIFRPNVDRAVRASALRDFDTFRQSLSGPVLLAVLDAPWTPVFVIIGFLVHWTLGLMGLVSVGLLIGLACLNERATRSPLEAANRQAAAGYAEMEHAARSADTVRALGMRSVLVRRQVAQRRQILSLQCNASLAAGGYLALIKAVRLMLQTLALGLGAWLAIDQKISPGAVFATSFLLARTLAPIEQIVGAWRSFVLNRAACANLSRLLGDQPAAAPTRLPQPKGALSVEGLGLLGGAPDRPILGGVSFAAAPGEIIGVVGPSGAGKSSLARILANAVRPDRGIARLDGSAYGDWDPEHLAGHIGYLPQDFVLFAGTVKENISRFLGWSARPSAALDEMAIDAATIAGAHAMIQRLPKGYDTVLGAGGVGLSAGQAQRIALARALFGAPRLIVLDEPNAHLDSEGEAALCAALSALREDGRTIVVAAHRGSVLDLADKLLTLEAGRAVSFGAANRARDQRWAGVRSTAPIPLSYAAPHRARTSA